MNHFPLGNPAPGMPGHLKDIPYTVAEDGVICIQAEDRDRIQAEADNTLIDLVRAAFPAEEAAGMLVPLLGK